MYCKCCYSVCKSDIDLVLDVRPVERPARADRDTDRAERGRCFDTHVQVFPLDEHLGQGRYPIRPLIVNKNLVLYSLYFIGCLVLKSKVFAMAALLVT